MAGFVKVGNRGDFKEGRGKAVKLDGVRVAIFRHRGRLHALQDACPHMGAWLSDGKIVDDSVVCHWHGWKFELASGQADMRSWACARVYEVKLEGDDVLLRRPDPDPPDETTEDDWVVWDDEFLKSPREDP